MTQAEMQAQIDQLKADNTRLQAKVNAKSRITMKVSEKGALSVYGLGRFPVTLYREQWERLCGLTDDIKAFILANSLTLKVKGEDDAKPAPQQSNVTEFKPGTVVRSAGGAK